MTTQSQSRDEAPESRRPALANPRRLSYLPALEGVRGAALFVVLTIHVGMFLAVPYHYWLVPGGYVVMEIFFGLSGFLITAMLLVELARTDRINFRRFYKRRAMRLFPVLVVVLVAHLAMTLYYKGNLWTELRTALFALSFTANYQRAVGITPPWDLNIVWSLAVEGQFYLVWPFTVWLIHRFTKTPWGMVAGMVPLVIPLAVLRYWEYTQWGWLLVYDRTEGRLPAFILGGVLAVLWCYDLLPRRLAVWAGAFGGLVIFGGLWMSNFEQPYRYPQLYLLLNVSGMSLVAACLFNDSIVARLLSPKFLRLAGRVSYSFYLVHTQVYIWVLFHRSSWSMLERVVGAVGISLVLGTLCFLIAERPVIGRPNLRRQTQPAAPV